jgi:threonine dehydrogenase-like Zn-dependent dehydrogenase
MVVKIGACGICPVKDMAWYQRTIPSGSATGIALGHEFSGEIVEVGPKVTAVKVGDRFYGYAYRPCGKCEACLAKRYGECANPYQGSAGTWVNGAMAEYLLVPCTSNDRLIALPDDISDRNGALLEPFILGIGLANKAEEGDVVIILGMDFMMLCGVAKLKKAGLAKKVIVSDVSKKRLKAAEELGADVVINELKDDVVRVVMRETKGLGADLVIEATQRPVNLQQAVAVAQPLGAVWTTTEPYYGHYTVHPNLERQRGEHPEPKGREKGFTMQNAWGTLGPMVPRLQESIEFMRAGTVTAEKYVSHVFPIDKVKEAFEVAINPHESLKVIIEP